MSKAVLISIRPEWCELIASGKKTIEVRKTAPKIEPPFKCYIYETRGFERVGNDNLNCVIGGNGRGMVICEFICKMVDSYEQLISLNYLPLYYKVSPSGYFLYPVDDDQTQVSDEELIAYGGGCRLFGWHISDLVIYDDPKKLSEFTGLRKTKFGYAPYEITRPPQSWYYVEEK